MVPGTYCGKGLATAACLGTQSLGGCEAGKTEEIPKDYGMNKGIPFVTIADRVEVTVDLKAKRISGPPVVLKQ